MPHLHILNHGSISHCIQSLSWSIPYLDVGTNLGTLCTQVLVYQVALRWIAMRGSCTALAKQIVT